MVFLMSVLGSVLPMSFHCETEISAATDEQLGGAMEGAKFLGKLNRWKRRSGSA